MIIAIDGPAASGKSSVAQRVAAALQLPVINTGNMYRAVTLAFLQEKCPVDGTWNAQTAAVLARMKMTYCMENGAGVLWVNGAPCSDEVRSPRVSECVSAVSSIPEVRTYLVEVQRHMAAQSGVVMEGRDIGTVVFPQADYKFFLTASADTRARRRLNQQEEVRAGESLESLRSAIEARDALDASRKVSPLRCAQDAVTVDSSEMNLEETVSHILAIIQHGGVQ